MSNTPFKIQINREELEELLSDWFCMHLPTDKRLGLVVQSGMKHLTDEALGGLVRELRLYWLIDEGFKNLKNIELVVN